MKGMKKKKIANEMKKNDFDGMALCRLMHDNN